MNTPSDLDPFPFNDRLRSVYDDDAPDPTAPLPPRIWAGVQTHLPPAAPAATTARRAPLLAGAGGVLLGILLMLLVNWWRPEPAKTGTAVASPAREATSPTPAVTPLTPVATSPKRMMAPPPSVVASPARVVASMARVTIPAAPVVVIPTAVVPFPVPEVASVAAAVTAPTGSSGLAAVGAAPPQVPAILLPLVQTETALADLGADTARAARELRRAALLAERAALATLTRRTDSLLLGLGQKSEAALAIVADSVSPAPVKRRWSVLLAFAPERNFFGLSAPAGDTLSALRRTHEQGRGGYNANVGVEYRVSDRLSVGAGLGVASYGAELRLTDRRTVVSTKLDSATITNTQTNSVTTRAHSVRPVPDSMLAPIVDFNNQVIGYEYLPTIRYDTVWTYLTTTDAITTTTKTYTPTVTTRQEVSARILRPNYRFLTLPLLVRYRLGRATDWTSSLAAPRWWADVAVGAQLQFFLGGTQLTTLDGRTYHTERVGPRGGPFRPLTVALTGAVALNYALTPRLSASLAPTLRYQVESVYRPSTNLTQRPAAGGVQLGLKLAF